MKRLLILFFLCVLIIPFVVKAEECDPNKITISSINIEEKNGNVEEIDNAIANGKDISLNLSMSDVGDNALYSFVVKNESNEDYELDLNSLNLSSEYMSYSISTEDNSNIVKANSSKTVHLRVEYKNEVPDNAFSSGIFQDDSTMLVNLSTGESISVPNTYINANIISILVIALIMIISIIMLKNNKYTKYMIIIGFICIPPISISALCRCDININSSVVITNNKFTGTIYRYNSAILKNGEDISKSYIVTGSYTSNYMYSSLEECENYLLNYSDSLSDDVSCEKADASLLNSNFVSFDPSSFQYNFYLRHEIENNIVKNSYVCFLDSGTEYCMKGGDTNSYEENAQIVQDYHDRHSYCYYSNETDGISCSGLYGNEISAFMSGEVSFYYIFNSYCKIDSNGYSYCYNFEDID